MANCCTINSFILASELLQRKPEVIESIGDRHKISVALELLIYKVIQIYCTTEEFITFFPKPTHFTV